MQACRHTRMATITPSAIVAANIRAEMGRRMTSQAGLAEKMGRTQQFLSRRLTGQTNFTIEEIAQIAAILEVSVSTLLGAVAA